MRTMSVEEIDSFVVPGGFAVLSLAAGNHAYGVPLFFGWREGAAFFQTRAGQKTRYLYATTEACLTVSRPQPGGEWASVQLVGRLERVDALSSSSLARSAIRGVPPPLDWADDDARADEEHVDGVTTWRLIPSRRVGRYSQPPALDVALDESF
jgi:nitroimidazol reductase NimA-like FMN-containing flavoprotein (pyridoxamine 5'-phosphate oxidase superfamily)